MAKINLINLSGNLGNELIKAIYTVAYRLEATEVIVNKAKYNRYADVQMVVLIGIIKSMCSLRTCILKRNLVTKQRSIKQMQKCICFLVQKMEVNGYDYTKCIWKN